ncbi:MAG: FtsW/RodA/SpoVE family cell cycle protein [Ndongobacter sp.]|nr:FtsW/RodA/SpoVE family cell cycle protein [Ndongobacter sp.]
MKNKRMLSGRMRSRLPDGFYSNGKWLTLLFQLLSMFLVLILHIGQIDEKSVGFAVGLLVLTFLSASVVNRWMRGDRYLLLIVNLLFSIGVIMIFRIDAALGLRQVMMYMIGVLFFFIVYLFLKKTNRFWAGKTLFFYLAALSLFLITLVLGREIGGARNWISIGGVLVQPSEFAKIPFVFYVASWFQNYEAHQKSLFGRWSLMAGTYLLIGLFFLQRELGTATVFFLVLLSSQIAYEKNWKLILLNIALACAGMAVGYILFAHVRVRFDLWLDPWQDINDKGYQIVQSLFGLAAGGFFGTGLGLGKPDTIPLGYSDFIFASVVEEMGAFMGICVILLFLLLVYRGIKIAMNQERDFYSCLALASAVLFAAQALIMFGGVMKVIPLTGITIPFMTAGGSSLLASFGLLAVLQVSSDQLE